MANRNKSAGSRWELACIHKLKELGFDAVSSRQESRSADARGIDIVSKTFPFLAQCKTMVNQPNVHRLLTETDADLIFYQKTEKRGGRFYSQGEYAMLELDKFMELVDKAHKNKKQ